MQLYMFESKRIENMKVMPQKGHFKGVSRIKDMYHQAIFFQFCLILTDNHVHGPAFRHHPLNALKLSLNVTTGA